MKKIYKRAAQLQVEQKKYQRSNKYEYNEQSKTFSNESIKNMLDELKNC